MHAPPSLRQRLLDAEASFLAIRDNTSLHIFEQQWSKLCDDFQQAYDNGLLDEDLKADARVTFTKVAILAEDLASLETATDSFMNELDELFSRMSVEDTLQSTTQTPPRKQRTVSTTSHHVTTPRRATISSSPAYIPAAYTWLLTNLHNPYPSEPIKKRLSRQAEVNVRALEGWFKTVRSRIGWVAIYKKRFQGSRRMAETVARAVFSGDQGDLDIPAQIASEFHIMKSRAEKLFAREQALDAKAGTSTPSPITSRPATPGSSHSRLSRPPSLVFSSADSDSDQERLPEPFSCCVVLNPDNRAKSYQRSHSTIEDESEAPSSPLLIHNPQTTSHISSPTPYISTPFDVITTSSRKRRMSTTEIEPSRKRRKPTTTGFRPQVVSAPAPEYTVTDGSLQPSATALSPVPAMEFQIFLRDDPTLAFGPVQFEDTDLSQYVNGGLVNNAYCDVASSFGQSVAEAWTNDDRSLSEIVRDAPSSTTLKLIPLPDLEVSTGAAYSTSLDQWHSNMHPLSVTIDASVGRDLPPIHWSSSSLAGALGPVSQDHKSPSEPGTASDKLPAETCPAEANVLPETPAGGVQATAPSSLDGSLLDYNWSESLEATSSTLSRLEGFESIEDTSFQQLLDLLESPQYVGFAF